MPSSITIPLNLEITIEDGLLSQTHTGHPTYDNAFNTSLFGTFTWPLSTSPSTRGYYTFSYALADSCHALDARIFDALDLNPYDFRTRDVETFVIWDGVETEEVELVNWGRVVERIRDRTGKGVSFYKRWRYTPRGELILVVFSSPVWAVLTVV